MDRLAELLRLGATPVLSRYGLRREGRKYWLRTEHGDLLVFSFDFGRTADNQAADVSAGCFPRYQLERVKRGVRSPHRVPHSSAAMFWWTVVAPEEAAYGGRSWWALGERTAQTALVLARTLEAVDIPRLLSFADPAKQYAAVEAVPPDPDSYLHQPRREWGRVLVRLGREPRPDVERLLERIPLDKYSASFKQWAYETLDTISPPALTAEDYGYSVRQ
jgi:hypothetical protein